MLWLARTTLLYGPVRECLFHAGQIVLHHLHTSPRDASLTECTFCSLCISARVCRSRSAPARRHHLAQLHPYSIMHSSFRACIQHSTDMLGEGKSSNSSGAWAYVRRGPSPPGDAPARARAPAAPPPCPAVTSPPPSTCEMVMAGAMGCTVARAQCAPGRAGGRARRGLPAGTPADPRWDLDNRDSNSIIRDNGDTAGEK